MAASRAGGVGETQRLIHIHAGADELGRVYDAEVLIQSSMACAARRQWLPASVALWPAGFPWI